MFCLSWNFLPTSMEHSLLYYVIYLECVSTFVILLLNMNKCVIVSLFMKVSYTTFT